MDLLIKRMKEMVRPSFASDDLYEILNNIKVRVDYLEEYNPQQHLWLGQLDNIDPKNSHLILLAVNNISSMWDLVIHDKYLFGIDKNDSDIISIIPLYYINNLIECRYELIPHTMYLHGKYLTPDFIRLSESKSFINEMISILPVSNPKMRSNSVNIKITEDKVDTDINYADKMSNLVQRKDPDGLAGLKDKYDLGIETNDTVEIDYEPENPDVSLTDDVELNNESTSKIKWDPNFYPCYTPKEMLQLGVFEGKYLNDDKDEYPADWFKGAKVVGVEGVSDPTINKYGIKSRQSLKEWKTNGWIKPQDPKGWFQWYCRYYQGRRTSDDAWQIGRWRSFVARHQGQISANCKLDDDNCRPKQRQGLLQWAWDSSKKFDDPKVKDSNLKKFGYKSDKINEAVDPFIIATYMKKSSVTKVDLVPEEELNEPEFDIYLKDDSDEEDNMEPIKLDDIYNLNEALTAKERKKLKDDQFGIPSLRKYPLHDEAHVYAAIRFFNYVDKEHEKELAKNIIKAANKFDIPIEPGEKNKLREYVKVTLKKKQAPPKKDDVYNVAVNESLVMGDIEELRELNESKNIHFDFKKGFHGKLPISNRVTKGYTAASKVHDPFIVYKSGKRVRNLAHVREYIIKGPSLCKTKEELDYLRSDAYLAKRMLSKRIENIKKNKNYDKQEVKDIEYHIKWVETDYLPEINRRAKEMRDEAKINNESSVVRTIRRKPTKISNNLKIELDDKHYVPVYIILTKSDTMMGNVIRKVTGEKYNHASIAVDYNLNNLYSFARRDDGTGGLVIESTKEGRLAELMHADNPTEYALYVTFLSYHKYEKLESKLNLMVKDLKKYKYNMLQLLKLPLGLENRNQRAMICSEFVGTILKEGDETLITKAPSLLTPGELVNPKFYFVSDGLLKNYDPKNTKKHIEDLVKSNRVYTFLTESGIGNYMLYNRAFNINRTSSHIVDIIDNFFPTTLVEFDALLSMTNGGTFFDIYKDGYEQGILNYNADSNFYKVDLSNDESHLLFSYTIQSLIKKFFINKDLFNKKMSEDQLEKTMILIALWSDKIKTYYNQMKTSNDELEIMSYKQRLLDLGWAPSNDPFDGDNNEFLRVALMVELGVIWDPMPEAKLDYGKIDSKVSDLLDDSIFLTIDRRFPIFDEGSLLLAAYQYSSLEEFEKQGFMENWLNRYEYLGCTFKITPNLLFSKDLPKAFKGLIQEEEYAMLNEAIKTKSHNIELKDDGSLYIKTKLTADIETMYRDSLRNIKIYKQNDNIEGLKKEAVILKYMIDLITNTYGNQKINKKINNPAKYKQMMDLRAIMISTWSQTVTYIVSKDPDFDFTEYYNKSEYGKDIKLTQNELVTSAKLIGAVFRSLTGL